VWGAARRLDGGVNYKDVRTKTAGLLNDWGNVYRVPVSVLDAEP
jgi:hypothetical protein